MRTRALPLVLALLPLTLASAQDDAPTSQPAKDAKPASMRVALKGVSTTDGEPDEPNNLQGFVYTELAYKVGLRVDSLVKVGNKGVDKWIKGQEKKWAKKEPAAPPASLTIEVDQTTAYNGSKFYGEVQAHNFKGKVACAIKNAEGLTLAEFDYRFEYGKAVRKKVADGSIEQRTKPMVKKWYDELVQKALLCGILSQDTVREGMSEGQRKKAAKYVAKTMGYIRDKLSNSTEATKNGELMKFLDSLDQKD